MDIRYFEESSWTLAVIYHLGALENSIHIICDHKSKTACVVDPAWDCDLFISVAKDNGYKITTIWLTHWHPDHTNAATELSKKTGSKIYAGEHETTYLDFASNPLVDGQIVAVGDTKAKVINTPGHTAGGVCFLLSNRLIAGDTLFVYGAGHCILPGADSKVFFSSLQKLKQIPDDVHLHCGHDYGSKITTTMGEQKQNNPFLMIDNIDDFVRYREYIHDKTRAYPMDKMSKKKLQELLS